MKQVIPVVTFPTPLAEYSSDLKDRQAMFSQFVFVLKMRIKQAFHLLVHMRFLFFLSSPTSGHLRHHSTGLRAPAKLHLTVFSAQINHPQNNF